MIRVVKNNPQTTFKDLQGHLVADGVTVHSSTIQRNLHREKAVWENKIWCFHHAVGLCGQSGSCTENLVKVAGRMDSI